MSYDCIFGFSGQMAKITQRHCFRLFVRSPKRCYLAAPLCACTAFGMASVHTIESNVQISLSIHIRWWIDWTNERVCLHKRRNADFGFQSFDRHQSKRMCLPFGAFQPGTKIIANYFFVCDFSSRCTFHELKRQKYKKQWCVFFCLAVKWNNLVSSFFGEFLNHVIHAKLRIFIPKISFQ